MSRSFLVFVLLSIFVILALNVEALVAPGPGPSVLPLPVDAPTSPQLLNGSRAGEYRNMSVASMGGKYCSCSYSCHCARSLNRF